MVEGFAGETLVNTRKCGETMNCAPDELQRGDAGRLAPVSALGLDLERLQRRELPPRLFALGRRVRVPCPEGDRAVRSTGRDEVRV